MDTFVSVVIPCHNDATNLARAVRSCLAQTALHEIIIVDDCSTDDSLQTAESLCSLDPRIAIFSTPRNMGPGAARNFGAGFASGFYLAFLDSDDEYMPDFLANSIDALQRNSEMQAIKADVEFVDAAGNIVLAPPDPRYKALVFSLATNVLIEREAFEKIGGFSENKAFRGKHGGEDVAFSQAIARFLDPLGHLEVPAYRYWNKPGSHLDRFLENTRVTDDGFEFISLSPEQKPGGALEQAIDAYMEGISPRFKKAEEQTARTDAGA